MVATPVWFGAAGRPLFGWLHVPDDSRARAGVVLCPPFGQEYMGTHVAFRLLAERIGAAGVAVLRLDYDGTGDSAGCMLDGDRLEAWLSSISAAVTHMRGLGLARVLLVGMRLGATMAAAVASRDGGIDGLVLWDPCRSGRSFLRQQRALAAIGFGDGEGTGPADGAVDGPAWMYSAATAAELAELDILTLEGPLAPRVLVLTRADRAPDTRLRHRLSSSEVEWGEAVGQAGLVDAPPSSNEVPELALRTVSAWVAAVAGGDPRPVAVAPAEPATVAWDGAGRPVIESAVRLGALGLFGIITEPSGPQRGPTVVFLDVAAEHRVGPARLWVELARQWAMQGVRSARFDFSGLGDSPGRPQQVPQRLYAPEAVDDVVDVAGTVAPSDPSDVVLVGLCSGAFAAMDAGLRLGARCVCAINPVLSHRPAPHAAGPGPARHVLPGLRRRLGPDTYRRLSWLRTRAVEIQSDVGHRLGHAAGAPTLIAQLLGRGVEVALIVDERSARDLARRSSGKGRSLLDLPQFHLVTPAGLDHSLLSQSARQEVGRALTAQLDRMVSASRSMS